LWKNIRNRRAACVGGYPFEAKKDFSLAAMAPPTVGS